MSYGQAYAVEDSPVEQRIESALQKKKVKRPGFLDRWLFRKLQNGAAYEQKQKQEQEAMNIKVSTLSRGNQVGPSVIDNQEKSIRFTVHVANGGRVIETQKYDRHKDRHSSGLYVITSEQDFGHEIDKIITMESLK